MARIRIRLSSHSRDTGTTGLGSRIALSELSDRQRNMEDKMKRVDRNLQTFRILLTQPSLTSEHRQIIANKLEHIGSVQKNAEEALSKLNSMSHIAELNPKFYQ